MTDMLKGSQVLQKTYTYIENVTKESRKALMEQFSQNHKGIGINSAPDILRQSVLDWFPRRDPMLKLTSPRSIRRQRPITRFTSISKRSQSLSRP